MSLFTESRTARRAVAACLLAVIALQFPAVTAAGTVTDLRPDLRMALPGRLKVVNDLPRRQLIFDSTIVNVGDGELEVHGKRVCHDCTRMKTKQWIKRSDGTWRIRKTPALQRYTNADFHHHWHVMGMERYEIFPLDGPFPNGEVIGHKYGFCFFDGVTTSEPTTGPEGSHTYSFYDCGTPNSQTTLVGLSVGWGDIYPREFPGQFIDIQDIPAGDYLVCLTADPANDFAETRNGNNQSWAKITLTAPPEGQTDWALTVGQMGRKQCRTQLPWMPQGPGGAAALAAALPSVAAALPSVAAALPSVAAADGGATAAGRAVASRFTCSIGSARARA